MPSLVVTASSCARPRHSSHNECRGQEKEFQGPGGGDCTLAHVSQRRRVSGCIGEAGLRHLWRDQAAAAAKGAAEGAPHGEKRRSGRVRARGLRQPQVELPHVAAPKATHAAAVLLSHKVWVHAVEGGPVRGVMDRLATDHADAVEVLLLC